MTPTYDTIPSMMTDDLKAAIRRSPQSRYRIAKATDIDQGSLSKWMRGMVGLQQAKLDRLCEYLSLRLVADDRRDTTED